MVSIKALAHISKVKVREKEHESVDGIIYAEKLWTAIASEYVSYHKTIPRKFSFILPYLEVLKRCMEIENILKSVIRWIALNMKLVKSVMDMHSAHVEKTHDPMVLEKYRIIART